MNQYALYLRKSRADLDAEQRGEGETLSKHRAALTDFAHRRGLLIVREYAEIISGDSIAARPQMQLLLEDVKRGLYSGVIVNDIDRLGRGDSIDQEVIKLTFAASHTLIITPNRDIDPANPSDDDMLDFSMFMARFEYKKIAQRMQQGRTRSAASGNWVTGPAPFGYKKVKNGKTITLEPDPDSAPIVQKIFDWYAKGEAGYHSISKRLASMGIKSQNGNPFSQKTVRDILHNPAYIGRLEYGKTATASVIEDGHREKRRIKSKPIVIDGALPAIVDRKVWQAAQNRSEKARHKSPITTNAEMKSPLAGLVVCPLCGHYMQRIQSSRRPLLVCVTHGCKTSGMYVDEVEAVLLDVLKSWKMLYSQPSTEPVKDNSAERDALIRQRDQIEAQLTRAQELVETGIYTPSEYMKRRNELEGRLKALQAEADKLTSVTPDEARRAILPAVERVVDAYPLAQTVEQKNALLRSVIDHIDYHKTQAAKRNENPAKYLSLTVYPISYSI